MYKVIIIPISIFLCFLSIILAPKVETAQASKEQFLTYVNPDYNIQIQYPSNWTKSESNLPKYSPVIFYTPITTTQIPDAALRVGVRLLSDNTGNTLDSAISAYTKFSKQGIATGEVKVVNSSYVTFAGLKGYQTIYYDSGGDSNLKGLDIFTVKDHVFYLLVYTAQPGSFSHYFPITQRMIDSFQITK